MTGRGIPDILERAQAACTRPPRRSSVDEFPSELFLGELRSGTARLRFTV